MGQEYYSKAKPKHLLASLSFLASTLQSRENTGTEILRMCMSTPVAVQPKELLQKSFRLGDLME